MAYPAVLTHDRLVMRVLLSEVTGIDFTSNSFTWSVSNENQISSQLKINAGQL